MQLKTDRLLAYVNYSFTDATFQSGFVEAAGSNPQADANGNITIRPGNRLPGIPANLVKFGLQYKVTDAWTVGGTAVAQSGTYLFGDEANLNPKLPAYVVLNLNTSYQMTPHIQLFGLVQNVTDQKYYTYGTFSPITSVFLAQAPNATNPRSYSPAAPIGGFVGRAGYAVTVQGEPLVGQGSAPCQTSRSLNCTTGAALVKFGISPKISPPCCAAAAPNASANSKVSRVTTT